MDTAMLIRTDSSDAGTFGMFSFREHVWISLELPDRENKSGISRIPAGEYSCKYVYSPRFKRNMYGVLDVPGRSGIRIHAANFAGDVEKGLKCHLLGCIALGGGRGTIGNQRALLLSRPAVIEFENLANGEDFLLRIEDHD